jgi:hypothetical protein
VPPHHCRPKVWNDERYWCIRSHARRAWRMEPSCTTKLVWSLDTRFQHYLLYLFLFFFSEEINQILVSSDISTSRKY